MDKETWLLVANSCVAHVFKVQKKHSLEIVETLEHPEGHLRNQDLVSDRPGRDNESMNNTRHAIEPKTWPKEAELENFSKTISKYLDSACSKNNVGRLYLAASPNLLGLLRQKLNPNTTKLVNGEVDKDLTKMKPSEIINNLPFLL
ncbi:MAG: host attachment protein [Parachlamydiaceae bacterium]|nr:host attachment protein [Parachlamydiaceae bacterium]